MEISNLHPRRYARERVLKALFAQGFSDDDPSQVLEHIMGPSFEKKKNLTKVSGKRGDGKKNIPLRFLFHLNFSSFKSRLQ